MGSVLLDKLCSKYSARRAQSLSKRVAEQKNSVRRWEFYRLEHYKFFQHKQCEYFPCHAHADPERFSCIFCYCPLYALGDRCGGAFRYTENGIKDCSGCLRPHNPDCYDEILDRFSDIVEVAKRQSKQDK